MSVSDNRPVVEQIAQKLLGRLQALAADYGQLHYSEAVRTTLRSAYETQHMQIVLTQVPPVPNDELTCSGNPVAKAWDVQFNIRVHCNPSEADPTPIDEYLNTAAADIIKCVCDETLHNDGSWASFGNLAINAQWQAMERVDADGAFGGVNVPLLVTYRVSETNPYTVRV